MTQGKGSRRRPAAVPPATVDANYARTFMRDDAFAELMESMGEALEHAKGKRSLKMTRVSASPDPTDAE